MSDNESESFFMRSLKLLNEEILRCQDTEERLVLLARKAGGLARHSYLVEAKQLVDELRGVNNTYDPRLSGWILFSEGLIEHFENLDNMRARDKFVRSFLVGQMASERELAGASAAWVAHCEFVSGKIDSAAEHILKAFEWSLPSEHEARGRAAMVLADAYNAVDDLVASRHWFRFARNHASLAGDIAMQNVMIFNIAAYSVSRLTILDCLSIIDPKEVKRTSMEVASATNFNSAIGIESLPLMIPAMRAELMIVECNWTQAIAFLDECIPHTNSGEQARLLPKLFAQRAWCRAKMGDAAGALLDSTHSLAVLADCTDDDDLSVLYFRLAGVEALIGSPTTAARHKVVANEHLAHFRKHQRAIAKMLDSVVSKLDLE